MKKLVGAWILSGCFLFSQSVPMQDGNVTIEKFSNPRYPPLAKTARVTGKVEVRFVLGGNGAITSLEVFSGHPMLAQGAVESIRNSVFSCAHCPSEGQTYWMQFDFHIRDEKDEPCSCEMKDKGKCDKPEKGDSVTFLSPHEVLLEIAPVCVLTSQSQRAAR